MNTILVFWLLILSLYTMLGIRKRGYEENESEIKATSKFSSAYFSDLVKANIFQKNVGKVAMFITAY